MTKKMRTRTGKMPGWFLPVILAGVLAINSGGCVLAQQPPFQDEITAFKRQDSMHPVAAGSIIFAGSSSFRMWTGVEADFPGYPIVNRGFGGSTLLDMIRYTGDIIIPYKPRQIVIYCGDNDLAYDNTVTSAEVYHRFVHLFEKIRAALPTADILFVSIKPSPSRANLLPKIAEANSLIHIYLRNKSHTAFADVYHPMLDSSGKPREELFIEDRLHMNAKGYAIWKKIIQPYLDK